jgi:ribosomal protein S18 acetylase RimI-like enzyme
MSSSRDVQIQRWDKDTCIAQAGRFERLCAIFWPDEPVTDLADKLSWRSKVWAVCAIVDDELVGFKLGYQKEGGRLHSWLGGVHPDWRREGLARRLGEAQQAIARDLGFAFITTSTRQNNRAMAILNLQLGFHICGYSCEPGKAAQIDYVFQLDEPKAV